MATSSVEICNQALVSLGATEITALNEDTVNAVLCNRLYEDTRDFVLRQHPWNSALAEQSGLSNTGTTPAIRYDYQFVLPTDPYCLRVLRVETNDSGSVGTEIDHEVRGRNLYANESTVNILFIKRITDINNFDAMLVRSIADRLAYLLAFPITRSAETQAAMLGQYQNSLNEAMAIDSQEGTPDTLVNNDLLEFRIRA